MGVDGIIVGVVVAVAIGVMAYKRAHVSNAGSRACTRVRCCAQRYIDRPEHLVSAKCRSLPPLPRLWSGGTPGGATGTGGGGEGAATAAAAEGGDAGAAGAGEVVCRVLKLLRTAVMLKLKNKKEQLEQDYSALYPMSTAVQAEGAVMPSENFEQVEQRFLHNLVRMLKKANYTPLTKEELEFALADEYLLTVPLQSDWNKLESSMLDRFLKIDKYAPKINYPYCNKFLVFHRGFIIDKTSGVLFREKLDVFINRILDILGKPFCSSGKAREPLELECNEDPSLPTYTIDRVRLQNSLLPEFWKKSTVQEPAFKEVFTLCKPTPDSQTTKALLLKGFASPLNAHGIFLHSFCNIPMADLELVFPEQKIGIKPLDLVTLTIGIVFSVIGLLREVFYDNGPGLSALLIGGGALLVQTIFSYLKNMLKYQNIVNSYLNVKRPASNKAALSHLLDCVEQQEVKEVIIGWSVLNSYGALTLQEFQNKCDALLKALAPPDNKTPLSFEAPDSLNKLQKFGVLTQSNVWPYPYMTPHLYEVEAILHKYINSHT
ncbi:Glycerophosphodiester phosphodiesterase gde1 [Pelomyxa schiedti]|nr:Glycerophosphodiester phosphodiesterase gde1 [Pelomyxa schiedti]